MARDFRPKGSKPAGGAATPAKATPSKATPSEAAPFKPTPSKSTPSKATPKKQAYDSDDSADEATLLREIQSFGGSREDLELISKNGSKIKGPEIDEAAFSGEVAAFLKQLQANPDAFEPASSPAKKVKDSTPAAKANDSISAKKGKEQKAVEGKKKEAEQIVKDKSKAKENAKANKDKQAPKKPEESATVQRMGKGKKMIFDEEGTATLSKPRSSATTSLRLDPVPQWMGASLPPLPPTTQKDALSHDRITSLLDLGSDLLRQESRTYDELTSSETSLNRAGGSIGTLTASDAQFVRSLLSSEGGGTLSDRISALTLLVQSSPVHNLKHMDNLLNMTRKKSREEASRATRALADWLASPGGLGDRKLRYFRDQPQLPQASSALALGDEAAKSHLLVWAFEDYLKKFYFSFLQVLESQSHDTISFTRKQATTQIFILLRDKPEQEQNLLRLLVNKLGDPDRGVAAKSSNHLLELLGMHPSMKFIVVREIANLILKPTTSAVGGKEGEEGRVGNHSTHARYYGLLTLNQTVLTVRDEATANHLILLYFELFEGILKANEAKEGKEEEEAEEGKKKDKKRWKDQPRSKKGRKSKGKNQPATIEEPKLVKDAESKMVVAILTGVRRAFPFAKLEPAIFEKHVNTLFRILHSGSFNISIQALQLIFQLTISSPNSESTAISSAAITDRFYRVLYDSLLDPRLEASSKQAMYLNLIFQALKADAEVERVKAFVKRLCQILSLHEPSFVCGALHLLGELFRRMPGLRAMLTEPEEEGEEHFRDVDSDSEGESLKKQVTKDREGKYDGRKRDPRFAHAGTTCLWDILPLLSHFHPSVSVHALQLLEGSQISTSADLSLNTLSHFLDRFVYRNPKQKAAMRGASAMQPSTQINGGVTRSRTHAVGEEEYFNSEKFWKKHESKIPADQLFFHKFFNLKSKQPKAALGVSGEDEDALVDSDGEVEGKGKVVESDEESLDSDDDPDEREIWRVMKATMPDKTELDGLEDSDEDDDEFDYVDSDAEEVAEEEIGEESDEEVDDGEEGDDFEDSDMDDGGEADLFGEDEDDLLPFTDFGSKKRGAADEEDEGEKGGKKADKKRRKKSMQNLPTFASAEDYAHLLGGDEDDE